MRLEVRGPDHGADDHGRRVDRRVDRRVVRIVHVARHATVADLAAALGWPNEPVLEIDGRPVRASADLADAPLYDGAVVGLPAPSGTCVERPAGPAPACGGAWELRVVGGLAAGRSYGLTVGDYLLGSGAQADIRLDGPAVSPRHAMVRVHADGRVDFRDLGSSSGSVVNRRQVRELTVLSGGDDVGVGGAQLTLQPAAVGGHATGLVDRAGHGRATRQPVNETGKVVFNRPPRKIALGDTTPLAVPQAPSPSNRPALAVASIVLPVVFAGVMVAVTRNPLFALMTLLSPVMAISGWWSSRRAHRRTGRSERSRFGQELASFTDELTARVQAERTFRISSFPDPCEIAARATTGGPTLWERRWQDPDALAISVGRADLAWHPPLTDTHRPLSDAVSAALVGRGLLAGVPAVVELAGGGVLGIVGPRPAALAVARNVVMQLAVLHGPADLALAVIASAGAAGDWAWAGWLGHCDDATGGQRLYANDDTATAYLDRVLAASAPEGRAGGRPSVRTSGTLGGPRSLGAVAGAVGGRASGGGEGPLTAYVIDNEVLVTAPRSPLRAALRGEAGPAIGVVVAATVEALPSTCTAVLRVDGGGRASLEDLRSGQVVADLVASGLSRDEAAGQARGLARFEDGEAPGAGACLPATCSVVDLLGRLELGEGPANMAGTGDPLALVANSWRARSDPGELRAPLGLSEDGPFELDLVADGPHALVAGTTGAGKSELLRSWALALAATHSPAQLNFVLIDYKGGSAFDECAHLPHTVGVVTDLDDALGERALRCLDAEIDRRMTVLRAASAMDYISYAATPAGRTDPLARLVVMIDEFATLAADLPDFLDRLVGIAQRGRSLGVHLVLATQRPAGAVNDNIRANTNIRIALRVQDAADSTDVIGVPAAAHLPRAFPGRAYVRCGPQECSAIQSAYSGGVTVAEVETAVRVEWVDPLGAGPEIVASDAADTASGSAQSDLARLVEATRATAARLDLPTPRVPWPPPLPTHIELDAVLALAAALGGCGPRSSAASVAFLLADDPDRQAQYPAGWDLDGGNLLVYGTTGSGTTTALVSVALALTERFGPHDLHLYGVDYGRGGLASLDRLPHSGGIIPAGDDERVRRLVRTLSAEVARRRAGHEVARDARWVVLIDGLRPLLADLEGGTQTELSDALVRVLLEGAEVGVLVAATAESVVGVRHAVVSSVNQKLVLRLTDAADARQFGLDGGGRSTAAGPAIAGRGQLTTNGLVVQVAHPGNVEAAVAANAARWCGATTTAAVAVPVGVPAAVPADDAASGHGLGPGPRRIGRLPTLVTPADLAPPGPSARLGAGERWRLAVGIGAVTLEPVLLDWYPGDHLLVAGPARSGRTAALAAVGVTVRAAVSQVQVLGLCRSAARSGPALRLGADRLFDHGERDRLWVELDRALATGHPLCLLVDDAETFDDADGKLANYAEGGVRIAFAGRADVLRGAYGHWTKAARAGRIGVLLQPDVDLDGDLLGARLPRRADVAPHQGRGYLIQAGAVELVQMAQLVVPRGS